MAYKYELDTPWRKWVTTAPNPFVRGYGADDGQRGWVTHAVVAGDSESFASIAKRKSACGIVPPHGWGCDLFIEAPCVKCLRATGLACVACNGTGYIGAFLRGGKLCQSCFGSKVKGAGLRFDRGL